MTKYPPIFACGATFSPCRTYRYALERRWSSGTKQCAFIGFNPSTADEVTDDPTVKRCIRFAMDWGFDAMVMLNLFAFRSTDPRAIGRTTDPVGVLNNFSIREVIEGSARIVVAWGAIAKGYESRIEDVSELLRCYCAHRSFTLGRLSKEGFPRHPLYMKKTVELVGYFDAETLG